MRCYEVIRYHPPDFPLQRLTTFVFRQTPTPACARAPQQGKPTAARGHAFPPRAAPSRAGVEPRREERRSHHRRRSSDHRRGRGVTIIVTAVWLKRKRVI